MYTPTPRRVHGHLSTHLSVVRTMSSLRIYPFLFMTASHPPGPSLLSVISLQGRSSGLPLVCNSLPGASFSVRHALGHDAEAPVALYCCSLKRRHTAAGTARGSHPFPFSPPLRSSCLRGRATPLRVQSYIKKNNSVKLFNRIVSWGQLFCGTQTCATPL